MARHRYCQEWFAFHAIRTSFVTSIVEEGANVKETQELARHSDPRSTMEFQSEVRASKLQGVAESVGSRILAPKCPTGIQREAAGAEGMTPAPEPDGAYDGAGVVEDAGIEPATSRLPASRSPS